MQACMQPGCNGTIDEGYCNVCGLAPLGAAPRSAPSVTVSAATVRTPPPVDPAISASLPQTSISLRSTRTSPTRTVAHGHRSAPTLRPPLPPQNPLAALVTGTVPERKRHCSRCDTRLSREAGFCPRCGQEYSFKPTLQAGDVVSGKYEIKGTLAFGGLGWIYLAMDTVLGRWVVLKGLLNARDEHLVALAVKEREFLAAVKHPNIVGMYDFIHHGPEGFIVMEYVNGKTLMSLRKESGPLPPSEAISYILEVLPAFAHIDKAGLVYCDFKPENAMVEGETVKLIDLGAVRRVQDVGGEVYGSRGYTAPEATDAPSPLSDLYSVGRALAVLIADFDFQGAWEHALPPDHPVFLQHPSLNRFLRKATRRDPETRFQSAEEMSEQLAGVLRDCASGSGRLAPVESGVFEPPDLHGEGGTDPSPSHGLPGFKVNPEDSGAPVIVAASALQDAEKRCAVLEKALSTHADSMDLRLHLVDELIERNALVDAEARLAKLLADHPGDWRLPWFRGRLALAHGKGSNAIQDFELVSAEVPGEAAPRLACAQALELAGDLDGAVHGYESVSRVDPSYTAAALGLGRCLLRRGNRRAAAEAYSRVPTTSNRYHLGQLGLARTLLADAPGPPTRDEIIAAGDAVEAGLEERGGLEFHRLASEILARAIELLDGGKIQASAELKLLGRAFRVRELRLGLEGQLRTCARLSQDENDRNWYIDRANQMRPVTWF